MDGNHHLDRELINGSDFGVEVAIEEVGVFLIVHFIQKQLNKETDAQRNYGNWV